MVGYRAYASLADRHSSLERLFSFSRELNVVPEAQDVLPSVLGQARDLLRGETAEIVRFDETGVTAWRSVAGRAQPLRPDEAEEAGDLLNRLLEGQEPLLSMCADLLPLWIETRPAPVESIGVAASRRRLLRPAL